MMQKLIKKMTLLSDIIKKNISPSLRMPSIEPPKQIQAPSLAPNSKKNPKKVAEQIKSPNEKDFAMQTANQQIKANRNPLAFTTKSDKDETMYHIHQDGQRLTDKPLSISEINEKHGGVKNVESAGFLLVPSKKEKLTMAKNGQWSLISDDE
jgi:hypothetical protein